MRVMKEVATKTASGTQTSERNMVPPEHFSFGIAKGSVGNIVGERAFAI